MTKSRSQIAKDMRERYKAQGKCPRCGGTNTGVTIYCPECNVKSTERKRVQRELKKND